MQYWNGAPWTPRAWQRAAMPVIVDAVRSGDRTVVSATMGAGKSVLIAELCHASAAKLAGRSVIVVLTPTQALVRQLAATIGARLGEGRVGMFYAEAKQLDAEVIVTCNPSAGRLAQALGRMERKVGLVVADECHQTQAERVRLAIEALGCRYAIGFTATPYRSDEAERLELWDRVAYSYGMGDALRDGVLVPWRLVTWDGQGSADCDDVCLRLMAEACRGIGPGVVSARSIEDAEEFAGTMRAAGWRAEAIHSRMGRAKREALLEQLRVGDLEALVHVSLLAEGVDFPWLRWLCMRRPVGARVRFAQEMGRPLRAEPGKTEAVIVDPHDLFGSFSIAVTPTLGGDGRYMDPLAAIKDDDDLEEVEDEPIELPEAVAVHDSTRWARSLLLTMQAHGLAPASEVPEASWRSMRPTRSQLRALTNLSWAARYLPSDIRDDVKMMCSGTSVQRLQRGAVSDLISIYKALASISAPLRKRHQHWSWPNDLVVQPLAPAVRAALMEE